MLRYEDMEDFYDNKNLKELRKILLNVIIE